LTFASRHYGRFSTVANVFKGDGCIDVPSETMP